MIEDVLAEHDDCTNLVKHQFRWHSIHLGEEPATSSYDVQSKSGPFYIIMYHKYSLVKTLKKRYHFCLRKAKNQSDKLDMEAKRILVS